MAVIDISGMRYVAPSGSSHLLHQDRERNQLLREQLAMANAQANADRVQEGKIQQGYLADRLANSEMVRRLSEQDLQSGQIDLQEKQYQAAYKDIERQAMLGGPASLLDFYDKTNPELGLKYRAAQETLNSLILQNKNSIVDLDQKEKMNFLQTLNALGGQAYMIESIPPELREQQYQALKPTLEKILGKDKTPKSYGSQAQALFRLGMSTQMSVDNMLMTNPELAKQFGVGVEPKLSANMTLEQLKNANAVNLEKMKHANALELEGMKLSEEKNKVNSSGLDKLTSTAFEESSSADDVINRADRFLSAQEKFGTGIFAPATLNIMKAAVATGTADQATIDAVAAGEEIQNLGTNWVMDFVQKSKGSISDAEMKIFTSAAPGLSKTPFGNAVLLDAAKEVANRVKARAEFFNNYINDNPNTSVREVQAAWNEHMKTLSPITLPSRESIEEELKSRLEQ